MIRGELSEAEWAFFEPFVFERGPKRGRPPADHRRVLDAVFWIGRTGAPWRDLPEELGKWASVYRQFLRWTRSGLWDLVLEALAESRAAPDTVQMIDSTIVRAHQDAVLLPERARSREGRRDVRPSRDQSGSRSTPLRRAPSRDARGRDQQGSTAELLLRRGHFPARGSLERGPAPHSSRRRDGHDLDGRRGRFGLATRARERLARRPDTPPTRTAGRSRCCTLSTGAMNRTASIWRAPSSGLPGSDADEGLRPSLLPDPSFPVPAWLIPCSVEQGIRLQVTAIA